VRRPPACARATARPTTVQRYALAWCHQRASNLVRATREMTKTLASHSIRQELSWGPTGRPHCELPKGRTAGFVAPRHHEGGERNSETPSPNASSILKGCFSCSPSFLIGTKSNPSAFRGRGWWHVKRHIGDPVSLREHYLTRAAELHARARSESDEMAQREYENLAKQFLRLAEQAKHNASLPPPMKISVNHS